MADEAETIEETPETETPVETEEVETETPVETDWRAPIEDGKVRKFADQFTSPTDLAKAAFEQRQQISKAVFPPGKGATDEDIAKYHKQIGVPEAYEWDLPEGHEPTEADTALQTKAGEVFKSVHMNATQQKAVNGLWNELQTESQRLMAEQSIKDQETQADALRSEWGNDYDANMRLAGQAWGEFGDSSLEDLKLENGTRVGDHPGLMKIMAEVGRRIGESGGMVGLSSSDAESMEEQRIDYVRKSMAASARGDSTEANKWGRKADELAEKLSGNQPIVGAQGRAA